MSTPNGPTMPLDPVLRDVLSALDGVPVWVDSGTLLALRRDGQLLSWDGDIDVSCWVDDLDALLGRRDHLAALGFRVAVRQLGGVPYKLKLTPSLRRRRRGERHIDISIYSRVGDWALSPGIYRSRPSTPVWSWRHFPGHACREIALIIWLATGARRNRVLRWPTTTLTMFTWCVPAHFFDHRDHLTVGNATIPTPSSTDEYLAFRYRDWTTPSKDWSYFSDDRSVLAVRPERALAGYDLPDDYREWCSR